MLENGCHLPKPWLMKGLALRDMAKSTFQLLLCGTEGRAKEQGSGRGTGPAVLRLRAFPRILHCASCGFLHHSAACWGRSQPQLVERSPRLHLLNIHAERTRQCCRHARCRACSCAGAGRPVAACSRRGARRLACRCALLLLWYGS